ncbi:MAG: hypothetical protein BM557_09190 [Flavobacterium sp. MedPE-SWcel]|nr:MAG: hypothetical protein BM557_09190 [Flavobacterium sp. MedPE-SWcel]
MNKLLNRITLKAVLPLFLLVLGEVIVYVSEVFRYTEYNNYMAFVFVLGCLVLLCSLAFSFACSLDIYRAIRENFKRYYILLLILALLPLFLLVLFIIELLLYSI